MAMVLILGSQDVCFDELVMTHVPGGSTECLQPP